MNKELRPVHCNLCGQRLQSGIGHVCSKTVKASFSVLAVTEGFAVVGEDVAEGLQDYVDEYNKVADGLEADVAKHDAEEEAKYGAGKSRHRGYDLPETKREDEERLAKEHEKEQKLVQQAGLPDDPEYITKVLSYVEKISDKLGTKIEIEETEKGLYVYINVKKGSKDEVPKNILEKISSEIKSIINPFGIKFLGIREIKGTDVKRIAGNPVSGDLPEALDSLLQDLAQYGAGIDYTDIMAVGKKLSQEEIDELNVWAETIVEAEDEGEALEAFENPGKKIISLMGKIGIKLPLEDETLGKFLGEDDEENINEAEDVEASLRDEKKIKPLDTAKKADDPKGFRNSMSDEDDSIEFTGHRTDRADPPWQG